MYADDVMHLYKHFQLVKQLLTTLMKALGQGTQHLQHLQSPKLHHITHIQLRHHP